MPNFSWNSYRFFLNRHGIGADPARKLPTVRSVRFRFLTFSVRVLLLKCSDVMQSKDNAIEVVSPIIAQWVKKRVSASHDTFSTVDVMNELIPKMRVAVKMHITKASHQSSAPKPHLVPLMVIRVLSIVKDMNRSNFPSFRGINTIGYLHEHRIRMPTSSNREFSQN